MDQDMIKFKFQIGPCCQTCIVIPRAQAQLSSDLQTNNLSFEFMCTLYTKSQCTAVAFRCECSLEFSYQSSLHIGRSVMCSTWMPSQYWWWFRVLWPSPLKVRQVCAWIPMSTISLPFCHIMCTGFFFQVLKSLRELLAPNCMTNMNCFCHCTKVGEAWMVAIFEPQLARRL